MHINQATYHSITAATFWLTICGLCFFLLSCEQEQRIYSTGGLYIPDEFEAVVVVDSLKGKAREITVNENGDVYVKLRYSFEDGGIAALRGVFKPVWRFMMATFISVLNWPFIVIV